MKSILDAEFHPVIEEFISQYVDDEMGAVEREAFEELLVTDDGIRDFAFAAKKGKAILQLCRKMKDYDGLMTRMRSRQTGDYC